MKTILVTGGSGFIGSYVVDRLERSGFETIILDHSDHPSPSGHKRGIFLGDIRDDVAVLEAMAHADGFIHLAGVLGTQETIGNPKPAIMTNIGGGLNVLEAAVQYDVPGVNIAVGNYWENNPYSIAKNMMERLCFMFNQYRGGNISVVRALNAYGPRQSVASPYGPSKVRKIMPSFVMRALYNDPIQVYGDGEQVMDMVYVTDVADVLVDTLCVTMEEGALADEIPEAGTGVRTTVKEIAETVIDVVGRGRIEHLPMRPGETPGAVVLADPKTLEGLYPDGKSFVTLREGVERTVEWYRRQL